MEAAALTRTIEELTAHLEARSEERRQAERDAANQGAALKQMEAEVQRIERRLQEWTLQAARNKEAREAKHAAIEQKREEAVRLETEHKQPKRPGNQQQAELAKMRQSARRCSRKQRKLTAELAGLEERRRGAEAGFQRIDRLHADLERRVLAIEQQRRRSRSRTRAAHRRKRHARGSADRSSPRRKPKRRSRRRAWPPKRMTFDSNWQRWRRTEERARRAGPVARRPGSTCQRSRQAAVRSRTSGSELPERSQRRGRRAARR